MPDPLLNPLEPKRSPYYAGTTTSVTREAFERLYDLKPIDSQAPPPYNKAEAAKIDRRGVVVEGDVWKQMKLPGYSNTDAFIAVPYNLLETISEEQGYRATQRDPPHVPCSIKADPRLAALAYLKNHPDEKDIAVLNVKLEPGKDKGFTIETTDAGSTRIPVGHLPVDYLDVGVIKQRVGDHEEAPSP